MGVRTKSRLPVFSELNRLGTKLDPAKHLPMLITGIAGVAGFNAFAYFRQKYGAQVIGQRPKRNWPLSGDGIVGVDLEDTQELTSLLEKHKFQTVLNCGGSCALKGCELDPSMANRVNVFSVQSLVDQIKSKGIRFIHLSIDLVFSGARGGHHIETDFTDPVTVYGKTMVKAENLILDQFPEACILRISLPMGVSFNGHAGAIDWIESRFANNKPATLYYDEVRTPVYVECLNETVEQIIETDCQGVFHSGGQRKLSLYQIAQIVNVVGGYDPKLLQGCYRIEAGPIPPRAGNVTMNSQKLASQLRRKPFVDWPSDPSFVPDSLDWHFQQHLNNGRVNRIGSSLYFRDESRIRGLKP